MKKWLVGIWVLVVLSAFLKVSDIRGTFFSAFSSGSVEKIDAAIAVCEKNADAMATAYRGALLMRKADLIRKGPGEKLKLFKEGHAELENLISAQPDNIELRFIRLCIQEKAPKVVRYRGQIQEDKALLIEHFSSLPQDVRNYVRDFAKTSEVLTLDELK